MKSVKDQLIRKTNKANYKKAIQPIISANNQIVQFNLYMIEKYNFSEEEKANILNANTHLKNINTIFEKKG